MNKLQIINNAEIAIKEYSGQRVVTFKDIDAVHGRPDGTARKRFNDNRERFVDGEDYFKICASEFRTHWNDLPAKATEDVTLITESGYLMLVKSFTDALAWKVQRELIKGYFRAKEQAKPMSTAQRSLKRESPGFSRGELSNIYQLCTIRPGGKGRRRNHNSIGPTDAYAQKTCTKKQ